LLTARRRLVAALLMLAAVTPAGAQSQPGDDARTEKRVALVIGNAAYTNSPLRNPVNDARAIAQTLIGLEFDVIARQNVGEKEMRRAIFEFGDKLKGGGVGLFFFAGHGMQVAGRNFLIPIGAEINSEREVELEAVDVARVLARMDEAKNRLNIVILDACRDNPFVRSFRGSARGLAQIDAPTGTLIAYATAPGRLARDGDGGNGLYTGELLKAIREPGLKLEDVFKRVRQAVRLRTNGEQVPWEASSVEGDFVFRKVELPKALKAEDGAQMVLVPAGEFWMGSDVAEVERFKQECRRASVNEERCRSWGKRGETPRHRVYLDAFYIDRHEATNASFEAFVGAAKHRTTAERQGSGWLGRERDGKWKWERINGAVWQAPGGPGTSAAPNHPVVQVSWHDAYDYCRWAGKRLPTEAEWEKAARGTDGRRYPWGDDWDASKANAVLRVKTTRPVGSYPSGASPYGALDMAGNVTEWVADWFDEDYYSRSPQRNPSGPSSGQGKVIRGGGWHSLPINLRTPHRGEVSLEPGASFDFIGFRCAKDVTP
jgi:formylglycine-generating enzyme required for sulfatase activity